MLFLQRKEKHKNILRYYSLSKIFSDDVAWVQITLKQIQQGHWTKKKFREEARAEPDIELTKPSTR